MSENSRPKAFIRFLEVTLDSGVTPFLITETIAVTNCYVSSISLTGVLNKLEVCFNDSELTKFKEYLTTLLKTPFGGTPEGKQCVQEMLAAETLVITIPLRSTERKEHQLVWRLSADCCLSGISSLFDSLEQGVATSSTRGPVIPLNELTCFYQLPQFKVVINGMQSTPCALCKHYNPKNPYCMFKMEDYACLFSSPIPLDNPIVQTEQVSNLIGNMVDPDLYNYDYDEFEREWYVKYPDTQLDESEKIWEVT